MNEDQLIKELQYKAVRSGGPGGQHVNKVSSKVQVFFDILTSKALSDEEKEMLVDKLKNRLIRNRIVKLEGDAHRSQFRNKEAVTQRLLQLIQQSLIKPKKRKPTKPGKVAVQKRLETKKRQSLKKAQRKNPFRKSD